MLAVLRTGGPKRRLDAVDLTWLTTASEEYQEWIEP